MFTKNIWTKLVSLLNFWKQLPAAAAAAANSKMLPISWNKLNGSVEQQVCH